MSKNNFVKVDEQILLFPEIRKLIMSCGYEGFGFYIALLTTMRSFHASRYRIPLGDLNILAEWQLNIRSDAEQERFSKFIEVACDLNLLKMDEDAIWSEWRVNDLMAQEELSKKQSNAGKIAMEKRYASKST